MTNPRGCIHSAGARVHMYGASTKGSIPPRWDGIDSHKCDADPRGAPPRRREEIGRLRQAIAYSGQNTMETLDA